MEFTIFRRGGVAALLAAIVIEVLLYVIVLWPGPITPGPLAVFAIVSLPSLWLVWVGIRRTFVRIDPVSHQVWSGTVALGRTIRSAPIGHAIERVVVVGDPEWAELRIALGRLEERKAGSAEWGFKVLLEGPGRSIALDQHSDHPRAEEQAREVARAASLPAIRRGYYLGSPRPGAINLIHSEEVWRLAQDEGVVITGDPTDSTPL